MKEKLIAALLVALGVVVLSVISWALTCGLMKLITICFDWEFSLKIATGIWLILALINLALYKGRE